MNFLAEFEIELYRSSTGSDKLIYPTGDENLDRSVQQYLSANNPIESVMYGFTVQSQQLDGHLLTQLLSKEEINSERLKEILHSATPDEGGPDSWMEGDIRLPQPYNEFEVVPILKKMWVDQNSQWVQLDLHSFYPNSYSN